MKILKKTIAFILTFLFLNSFEIFTFGSIVSSNFVFDDPISVNVAVFVSEDNLEEANIFLQKLCQKEPTNKKHSGILSYQYGIYNEFNLNFDLLTEDKGCDLENFIKSHPLALVLIDARLADNEWKSLMESYLHQIKSCNNEAFIIYSPLNAEDLIDEIGLSAMENKLGAMARYIEPLEQVLFRNYPEKEQVLSVAQIMDQYIPDKFLANIYDRLIKMRMRGSLLQLTSLDTDNYHVGDKSSSITTITTPSNIATDHAFKQLNHNIKKSSFLSEKVNSLVDFYIRYENTVDADPYFFSCIKRKIISFISEEINCAPELTEFFSILSSKLKRKNCLLL